MRIATWAVLAVTACGAGTAQGATVADRLALYDTLEASEILWGQESDAGDQVGIMDPPYFTATPGRVEVIAFIRYTNFTWQRSKPFTEAWRESLPDSVVVRRMPKGIGGNKKHRTASTGRSTSRSTSPARSPASRTRCTRRWPT